MTNKHDMLIRALFFVFLLGFICLEIYALTQGINYAMDMVIVIACLVFLYYVREFLLLHWFDYLLASLFLLLHAFGAFNAYNLYPFGIEFDFYPHFLFGFFSALIVRRWMKIHSNFNLVARVIFTLLIVLGFAAIHELIEFGGAIFFGEGNGVLMVGGGDLDEWDTQKDILNGLFGSLVSLGLYGLVFPKNGHTYK